jgi:cobalamin biosynthesis Mg chelatase CobN
MFDFKEVSEMAGSDQRSTQEVPGAESIEQQITNEAEHSETNASKQPEIAQPKFTYVGSSELGQKEFEVPTAEQAVREISPEVAQAKTKEIEELLRYLNNTPKDVDPSDTMEGIMNYNQS